MVEKTDNLVSLNSAGAPPADQQGPRHFEHTHLTGRFNQYTSGYWALTLPALATRYIARYGLALSPLGNKKESMAPWFAGIVGGWMSWVASLYVKRTYDDMKRVFSQTVAWENDKKPEEVGIRDIWNSKNDIVHRTMRNFLHRDLLRFGVSASFFTRLLGLTKFQPFQIFNKEFADSVDLGTGVTGAYLVSDVFMRTETFFEKVQNLIDNKINHANTVGETITSGDLLNLYVRYERDVNPKYMVPRMDSQQWHDDQVLFMRMADLMNETYGNAPNTEKAEFTIPKLIYLLGNGLVSTRKMEQSLAFIELASRSDDMREVKEARRMLDGGAPVSEVIERFQVASPVIQMAENARRQPANDGAPAMPDTKFVDKYAAEPRNNMRNLAAANVASHVEKARINNDNAAIAAGVA